MAITSRFNPCTSPEAECDYDYDYDDDAFYAELKRQILLLTDDEEFPETQHPSSPIKPTRQGVMLLNQAVPIRSCFRWGESEISGGPAPGWLLKLWSNGGGTGVFIPHVIEQRRVPVRSNKARRRMYRALGSKKT